MPDSLVLKGPGRLGERLGTRKQTSVAGGVSGRSWAGELGGWALSPWTLSESGKHSCRISTPLGPRRNPPTPPLFWASTLGSASQASPHTHSSSNKDIHILSLSDGIDTGWDR